MWIEVTCKRYSCSETAVNAHIINCVFLSVSCYVSSLCGVMHPAHLHKLYTCTKDILPFPQVPLPQESLMQAINLIRDGQISCPACDFRFTVQCTLGTSIEARGGDLAKKAKHSHLSTRSSSHADNWTSRGRGERAQFCSTVQLLQPCCRG